MSISNRITFMYGSMFAIAILIINAVIFINLHMYYREISQNEMDETMQRIKAHITSGGETAPQAIDAIKPYKYIMAFVYETNAPQTAPVEEFRGAPAQGGFPSRIINFLTNFNDQDTIEANGRYYHIWTYRAFDRERRVVGTFFSFFVLFNVLGWVGSFFGGRYVSRKMLKPIADIIKLASDISIDDLSKRIDINGPDDELNLLARTFNDMIGRLSVSFEKQSRFVSDASHELRTPISVIQGYANLLARWGKDDPAVLAESVENIQSETGHMSALVKKLLYIAGISGETKPAKDYMSLNNCVREILKEVEVMDLPHTITLTEDAEVNIYADYDMIRQMLWIFIENSMKYCKNGKAVICIRLYNNETGGVISIKDEGVGIKDRDLPHIFERFYRGDKSRSRSISGTGLGLSIAERIIQSHNATVTVTSKPDMGTYLEVGFEK